MTQEKELLAAENSRKSKEIELLQQDLLMRSGGQVTKDYVPSSVS